MIINAANLANLQVGYKAHFQSGFDEAPKFYDRIATVVPSDSREEIYPWLGDTIQLREWLGDRVVQNISAHKYAIVNKSFEATVAIRRDDIEDDKTGLYGPQLKALGYAAATHPDELVFGLLSRGFTEACYDGQNFFDADHPVGLGAGEKSVSNFMGGTGLPWYLMCTGRPLKPLIWQQRRAYEFVAKDDPQSENVFNRSEYVYGCNGRGNVGFGFWQMAVASRKPLTPESYEEARAAMLGFVSDAGKPLALIPDLLIVPPALEGPARRLLKNDMVGGSTNEWAGSAEPLVVPYLTEA